MTEHNCGCPYCRPPKQRDPAQVGWRVTRSLIARTIKSDPNADVTELRRRLKAERLEEHIVQVANTDPVLTEAQRTTIALVLMPPAREEQA